MSLRSDFEKMKELPKGKRFEYFWQYYKTDMIVIACVLVMIVSITITVVTNINTRYSLRCGISMLADNETIATFEEKAGKMGFSDTVTVDIFQGLAPGATVDTLTQLLSVIAAGDLDIVFGTETDMEYLSVSADLIDMTTILPEGYPEDRCYYGKEYKILAGIQLPQEWAKTLLGEPLYLTVLGGGSNRENAIAFAKALLSE